MFAACAMDTAASGEQTRDSTTVSLSLRIQQPPDSEGRQSAVVASIGCCRIDGEWLFAGSDVLASAVLRTRADVDMSVKKRLQRYAFEPSDLVTVGRQCYVRARVLQYALLERNDLAAAHQLLTAIATLASRQRTNEAIADLQRQVQQAATPIHADSEMATAASERTNESGPHLNSEVTNSEFAREVTSLSDRTEFG